MPTIDEVLGAIKEMNGGQKKTLKQLLDEDVPISERYEMEKAKEAKKESD